MINIGQKLKLRQLIDGFVDLNNSGYIDKAAEVGQEYDEYYISIKDKLSKEEDVKIREEFNNGLRRLR